MNKAEKLAEEYWENLLKDNPKGFHVSAYSNEWVTQDAFLAGYNAREKELLESSQEFDEKAVIEQSLKDQWALECPDCGSLIPDTKSLSRGARWQHAQDQLKYQGLFSAYSKLDDINIELNHRVKELEAELAELKEEK